VKAWQRAWPGREPGGPARSAGLATGAPVTVWAGPLPAPVEPGLTSSDDEADPLSNRSQLRSAALSDSSLAAGAAGPGIGLGRTALRRVKAGPAAVRFGFFLSGCRPDVGLDRFLGCPFAGTRGDFAFGRLALSACFLCFATPRSCSREAEADLPPHAHRGSDLNVLLAVRQPAGSSAPAGRAGRWPCGWRRSRQARRAVRP
jgi:hypothetical protein